MLTQLERGKADGVVIHKIDRSARNLRDWADLGELIDRGIDVHFAHDALDLRSRGGRLSADIQAVVAADYIRNLSEETRKGFYGRLKQGLYPLRAPIGYRDMGRGKVKEIDPVKGPLVRVAFELYATGEWNFHTLLAELDRRGLQGLRETPLSPNGLSTMLNNPFYTGLVHIRKTGETFEGQHTPLISNGLYKRVQLVLRGRKQGSLPTRHEFLFRRLLHCGGCGRCLSGERQRTRHVYYRCHTPACEGVSVNQTVIESHLADCVALLRFEDTEWEDVRKLIKALDRRNSNEQVQREKGLRLQLAKVQDRLNRLTDALIEGLLDKPSFEERKASSLEEKLALQERLENLNQGPSAIDVMQEMFEQANSAQLCVSTGTADEKRSLLQSLSSNIQIHGKTPAITLRSPYQELSEMRNLAYCDPHRDTVRTRTERIVAIFLKAAEEEIRRKAIAPIPADTPISNWHHKHRPGYDDDQGMASVH